MGNALCTDKDEEMDQTAEIFEDNASNRIRYYYPNRATFDPVSPPGEAEDTFFVNQVPKKATGELVKDGKYTKNSNRRYIILDGGFLKYYKGETSGVSMNGKTLAGTIDLRQYGLRNQHPKTPSHMVFVPINDDAQIREYDFEAHDEASRKSWEKIIDAHARYYRNIK